jgi:hypothetical protein
VVVTISWTKNIWVTQKLLIILSNLNVTYYFMTTETKKTLTTQEVATRFDELARQEMWFEIQDELFADHVRSVDPPNSPYFGYAEGKLAVRKKGLDWVEKITEVHGTSTTHAVVGGNHFSVGRSFEITVKGFGRIKIDEIMLYEVKDGQIVLEQFFY